MPGATIIQTIAGELAKKSASTGFDYFKRVLAKAGENVELRAEMLAFQETFLTLRDENARLRDLLRDAKEALELKEALVLKDGAYFSGLDTENIGGPYCKRCWEVDRVCSTMDLKEYPGGRREWICRACDRIFDIPSSYFGISAHREITVGLAEQIKSQRDEW